MLIESLIRREGGTTISMPNGKGEDDTEYHFAPSRASAGAHVCDVTKKAHLQRFLGIAEGFAIFDADESDKQEDQTGPVEDQPTGDIYDLDATNLEELEDDHLRAIFVVAVGRKPNARASRETLIAQIIAAREEAQFNAAKGEADAAVEAAKEAVANSITEEAQMKAALAAATAAAAKDE